MRDSVVVARGDATGERHLVAYLVSKVDGPLTVEDLRHFVASKLPDYMVPSAFVVLESLPLTQSGKIDRGGLLEPSADSRLSLGHLYVPPRTEIEHILTDIWHRVLRVHTVGTEDNYFALGGDSIKVVQIVHEASKCDLSLTAMDLFRHQTVAELARHIDRSRNETPGGSPPPLHLVEVPDSVWQELGDDVEDAYLLSEMQATVLYHYRHDDRKLGVYHFQQMYEIADETPSVEAFRTALDILIHRHPKLRTVFVDIRGGQSLQVVKRRPRFSIDVVDLCHLDPAAQEERLSAAILEDRAQRFDVTNPEEPLFRFRLFLRSDTALVLFMTIHHAITDGWGKVAFLNELVESVEALKAGKQLDRGTYPDVYKEFVALEREILADEEARVFWETHLEKHRGSQPPRRELHASASDPTSQAFLLESETVSRLRALAGGLSVSTRAVFLSAYLDVIAEESRSDTVTVGVVFNGRSERLSDPFGAMGLFWNIVPFCHSVSSDKLAQVREVQALLIDMERWARRPLAQILRDSWASELFFATFNFLHFHHSKESTFQGRLKMRRYPGHDKFHYPLNYVVPVHPFDGSARMRVEYDPLHYDATMICSVHQRYMESLMSLLSIEVA